MNCLTLPATSILIHLFFTPTKGSNSKYQLKKFSVVANFQLILSQIIYHAPPAQYHRFFTNLHFIFKSTFTLPFTTPFSITKEKPDKGLTVCFVWADDHNVTQQYFIPLNLIKIFLAITWITKWEYPGLGTLEWYENLLH